MTRIREEEEQCQKTAAAFFSPDEMDVIADAKHTVSNH